ncbi:unnamed protein product [Staurois parvus]|uniref:Uncharacterized protein n=1 Tax=Staurois parvus TaxID=386267 RepID=A0ABN9AAA3_9NEOB|nr:unnamed protein product [Staurois parvus]
MSLDTADHVVKGRCDWPFTTSRDQLCPVVTSVDVINREQLCCFHLSKTFFVPVRV